MPGDLSRMKKKLAIIGASYLQMPLVQKAKELGIETHCFAWADGAVCSGEADFFYPISVLDKETIYQQCSSIGIDGITTIATDIAIPTIGYVAEKLGLVANSYGSALKSTHKYMMRQAFQEHGCTIPPFSEVNTVDFLWPFSFPVIVKPVDRSGSRGVSKVTNQKELEKALVVACQESISGKAIVEGFIEGVEVSVESISWQGKHYILAITDKITTGAPHFVELAHHQPSQLSQEIQQRIILETLKCLDALEIKVGAGHSEFKITPEGDVFVIEVGARMGGDFIGSHLVGLSTGYDFLQGVVQTALNTFEIPILHPNKHAGVYFLSKETEKILPFFEDVNEFEIEKHIFSTDLKSINNSNDRSGYLIYQADHRIEL